MEDSICLKRMLEVVLALGNYLNGGTVRGGAHGFRLETLLKLQSIKSTDNAITLLNYLAELLSSDPDQVLTYSLTYLLTYLLTYS